MVGILKRIRECMSDALFKVSAQVRQRRPANRDFIRRRLISEVAQLQINAEFSL